MQQTLLHIAAARGSVKIIKMLDNARADVNVKDFNNKTPLHLAARKGRVEAVRCLMEITHDRAKAREDEKESLKESESTDKEGNEAEEEHSYFDGASLDSDRYIMPAAI